MDLQLNAPSTALVLIDLQRGIVQRQTAPYPASEVVTRAARLAQRFREHGAPVVLVHVTYSADGSDRLKQRVDSPQPVPAQVPPDFGEIVPELKQQASDIVITKRQWGAFYGTDLDLQLRRRGVDTIVIGGIATNFGVESTARAAWEHAYQVVFIEDAMAGLSAEAHQFAVKNIFPRLGLVRSTDDVLLALP
ncbi:MAG TPA: hydrolase [Thermoanaerobaculia bacterium]